VCECAVGIVSEWLMMVTPTHIVLASKIYEASILVVNVLAVVSSELKTCVLLVLFVIAGN
jgi:hypothetical protein